jgi:hypothetical protein
VWSASTGAAQHRDPGPRRYAGPWSTTARPGGRPPFQRSSDEAAQPHHQDRPGAALVLAGFGAAADAATGSSSSAASGSADGDGGGHAGGTPLTGDTAAHVKAAALARYPGATIDRFETDSDGVYEAHIVTGDGSELIVQVGKAFSGTQTGGGGDHDGDGPDAPDSSTAG